MIDKTECLQCGIIQFGLYKRQLHWINIFKTQMVLALGIITTYSPFQYSCLENPHGQRSLEGYSPWGCKELDTTVWLNTAHTQIIPPNIHTHTTCNHNNIDIRKKNKHIQSVGKVTNLNILTMGKHNVCQSTICKHSHMIPHYATWFRNCRSVVLIWPKS